jgi:hypothetical protein
MFLYTNKAFMTDLGSNFVVHLLLVHMILYLLTLQVHLFLEPDQEQKIKIKTIHNINIMSVVLFP